MIDNCELIITFQLAKIRVVYRQKLANQSILDGALLKEVTKISTVNQWVKNYKNKLESQKNLIFR